MYIVVKELKKIKNKKFQKNLLTNNGKYDNI